MQKNVLKYILHITSISKGVPSKFFATSFLEITICDEGILKKINLSLWIETTKNEGGFVYFE